MKWIILVIIVVPLIWWLLTRGITEQEIADAISTCREIAQEQGDSTVVCDNIVIVCKLDDSSSRAECAQTVNRFLELRSYRR